MWAAAQGHAEMVAMLVEAGADVNARSAIIAWERQRTSEPRDKWLPPGGLTPLLFAAREGRVDAAKALIAAGADVNVVDPDRQSALVIALINGHFDVADLLIEKGADVNMADKVGRTALWAAVDYNTLPQSNRPAPNAFDDETTSLDVIRNLLAHGARVDAPLTAQMPYRTKLDRGGDGVLGAGTTPLLRAAKAGDTPVIKLLLEKGANPKATTRNGVNALMMAANVAAREEDMTGRSKTQKDAIETITLLLAAGVDINATDTQGRTAAHGAALWGLTDVVRFLHKNGAKLDVEDKRGFTPLDAAMGMAGGFGFDSKAERRARGHGQGDSRAHGRGARLRPAGASPPARGRRRPQRERRRLVARRDSNSDVGQKVSSYVKVAIDWRLRVHDKSAQLVGTT